MEPQLNVHEVPWNLIRDARFGGPDVDPKERAGYYREALIWGAVPIELGVTFVVADDATAQLFYLEAARSGRKAPLPLVRPAYFFGL